MNTDRWERKGGRSREWGRDEGRGLRGAAPGGLVTVRAYGEVIRLEMGSLSF